MNILEVKSINKRIGKKLIINNASFNVKEGEIFGFLGPNGAGKTTTIRMLVGLIHPNSGEILISGVSLLKNKEKALHYVGAVVENPESYKYLSGRENLMQIARIRKVSKEEVQKLINLVGLEDRIDDKVSKYSLGMKQRLGLAAALIGKPKLLILDEPTNGLDPSGILDFREIVKKAAKENNMAVFISSHILSEIQTLCDTVAFINKGQIKSIETVKKSVDSNELDSITIIVDKIQEAKRMLESISEIHSVKNIDNEINIVMEKNNNSKIIKKLIDNNIEVFEFYKNRKQLEERYMELVEGGVR